MRVNWFDNRSCESAATAVYEPTHLTSPKLPIKTRPQTCFVLFSKWAPCLNWYLFLSCFIYTMVLSGLQVHWIVHIWSLNTVCLALKVFFFHAANTSDRNFWSLEGNLALQDKFFGTTTFALRRVSLTPGARLISSLFHSPSAATSLRLKFFSSWCKPNSCVVTMP